MTVFRPSLPPDNWITTSFSDVTGKALEQALCNKAGAKNSPPVAIIEDFKKERLFILTKLIFW